MLCEKCKNALQASVIAWRTNVHYDISRDLVECLSALPLHSSLCSFYKSITTGCYACRQLWATILERPDTSEEGRETSTGPFLSDPARAIPHSLDEFCRDFSKHTSTATSETVVKKRVLLTIICAIQTIILKRILHGNRDPRDFKRLIQVQTRCEQKSGIWLRIDSDGHYVRLCASNIYTRLDLRMVHPRTCEDAGTITGAISESQHASTASTARTANLWRYWLNKCLTTHSYCRVAEHSLQPFVPKRLIEILQDDNGESSIWRLVCPPVNCATQYLTMSHRWGSYQPIRLDKKTIHEFSNPTPVSKLPKTYQHALTVAHDLSFRYIWIDSLCILQDEDDKQDWEEQSKLMGFIYRHAACNIAATWASDGRDGLFNTNDPFRRQHTYITLNPNLDRRSESTSSSRQYQLWQKDSYHKDIVAAPLNQRGWVVQERYLSRRQLNFAKHQVYWECHELMASEQFPAGIPIFEQGIKTLTRHEGGLFKPHLDRSEIRQTWADLVNLYSSCRLTKESDKLVAISGLAREVGSMTQDVFIQGLWKKDFYPQLCWKAIPVKGVSSTTTGRRNAPSWFWAKIDGPVETARAYSDKDANAVPWMEVVEWPDPDDSTSRVALRGIILPHTSVEITDTCKLRLNFTDHDPFGRWEDPIDIRLDWDEQTVLDPLVRQGLSEIESGTRQVSKVQFFMILGHTVDYARFYRGIMILLNSSAGEHEEYVRVGTFGGQVIEGHRPGMGALKNHLSVRLKCRIADVEKLLNLNDPRLIDLVKTVYII